MELERYDLLEKFTEPPPLSEIEKNMTLYLTSLHQRLSSIGENKNNNNYYYFYYY